MSWVSLILAVLQLANKLLEYGQQQKWISEGQDQAIAAATAEILRKSNYAKAALDEMRGRTDAELDDFLRNLEPGRDKDGK